MIKHSPVCANLSIALNGPISLTNCRSWYILAFQAPILPELLLLSNDCEALDAGARTGPSAMKTDGAITVQEVERKGSSCMRCTCSGWTLSFAVFKLFKVTPGPQQHLQSPQSNPGSLAWIMPLHEASPVTCQACSVQQCSILCFVLVALLCIAECNICWPCRYKQAFQQPYAATAALNFYRAYMQNVTTNPSPSYLRCAPQASYNAALCTC